MTIDELARRTHTTARNIRAYQERGLLASPRLVARTAYYDQSHADRLQIIRRLQKEGFSLAAIRALLDAWTNGSSLTEVLGLGNVLAAATSAKSDASVLFPVTKFQRPISRLEHITRVRCLDELSKNATSHVLLTAPGGSGKSILAAQLLSLHDGANAWLSCEAADDDPRRFWTAVLIAIRSAVIDFGVELLDDSMTS